jgi:hypothetical protein
VSDDGLESQKIVGVPPADMAGLTNFITYNFFGAELSLVYFELALVCKGNRPFSLVL